MTTIGEAIYEEAQIRLLEGINEEAARDGWFIAHASGSENGEWQIQKDDEAAVFDGDDDAWSHVWQHAIADPTGVQMRALIWVQRMCPEEFISITKHCGPLHGPLPATYGNQGDDHESHHECDHRHDGAR